MKIQKRFPDDIRFRLSRLYCSQFAMQILCLLFLIMPGTSLKGQIGPISGPTVLCTSANYTIENWPGCCATVSWSTEGNVQLSSGQGSSTANFSVNGNGTGKVKADVYYCSNHTYLTLDIWSGPPILLYLSPETYEYGYAGNQYSFAAWPYYSIAEGETTWYTNPETEEIYNAENYVILYFEDAGYYYISAEVTNTCGSSGVVDMDYPYWPWEIKP